MAINNVLKDKLGKILNPKIPRYEILKYNLKDGSNPIRTGRKVNGKDEYIDVINIGSGPNNTEIHINYTTSDKFIINYYLIGISSSNEIIKAPNSASSGIYFNVLFSGNRILVNSNQDRSRFTCYVYVYFTYKD